MFKISPLGLTLTKLLAGLFAAECALFAGGRLIVRGRPIIAPPGQIAEWAVRESEPPVSDDQRDNPRQLALEYFNSVKEDQPVVHVDYAAVQSVNVLRQPQKYMVDSDGRIKAIRTVVLQHKLRPAYTLSVVEGIYSSVVEIHWCQKPGGDPSPAATDKLPDTMKAILLKRPQLYVCDIWVRLHPNIRGPETRTLLEKFAETLSDSIKNSG